MAGGGQGQPAPELSVQSGSLVGAAPRGGRREMTARSPLPVVSTSTPGPKCGRSTSSRSTSGGAPLAATRPPSRSSSRSANCPARVEVVHGGQHGERPLPAERVDQFERVDPAAEVQGARRLVEQQDRRLLGQRAGEHKPL